MNLIDKLSLLWDSDPHKVKTKAKDNPLVIESKIGELEDAIIRGTEDEQAAAAEAISNAVIENTTIGESLDVFQVILHNVDTENKQVRRPLIRALGKLAPVIDDQAKDQLVASTHILTNLLEYDDEYTTHWVQPAVRRAIEEYPDPFINHVDTIAETLDGESILVASSATRSLGLLAEFYYDPVKPHVPALMKKVNSGGQHQASEALRTIALIAANSPRVIEDIEYLSALKRMFQSHQPVRQRYAAISTGYLLSSQPDKFYDEELIALLKTSLEQSNGYVREEAAVACLRIIHNTEIEILDNNTTIDQLEYTIEEFGLNHRLNRINSALEEIEATKREIQAI